MADITVTVGGTPTAATYSGNPSDKVDRTGKITVEAATTTIQFVRATGTRWTFNHPGGITFDDDTPFNVTSNTAEEVSITDTDAASTEDCEYEYTLKTSIGDFDPQILNKSRL